MFVKISNYAFQNCQLLQAVHLHNHVQIDLHAFNHCPRLHSISFVKDVKQSVEFVKHLNEQTVIHCCPNSKLANMAYEGYKIVADM